MESTPADDLSALHHTVQQKVGRFVLIAQRHEQILKGLVIDSEFSGSATTAPENQRKRLKKFIDKSLGTVVEEFNKSYLREADAPGGLVNIGFDAVGQPHFHTSFGVGLTAGDLATARQQLLDFRDLRNRVVHHLIHDHDLATHAGCESAIAYLDRARLIAKERLEEAEGWAKLHLQTRDHAIAFWQSDALWDVIRESLRQDEAAQARSPADWEATEVVQLLRRAEQYTPAGEMTMLEAALQSVLARQTRDCPSKYQQKSWWALMKATQLFEVKRVKGTATEPGYTLYRSLAAAEQAPADMP